MNDLSQDNDSISLSMNDNNSNYRLNRKNDNENPNQNLYNYDINDQGIGLLPRIIYYLFNNSQKTENEEFSFKISYLEIYQETISDLLNPDSTKFVQLRDIGSTIILDGLRKLTINSPKEAIQYIIDTKGPKQWDHMDEEGRLWRKSWKKTDGFMTDTSRS